MPQERKYFAAPDAGLDCNSDAFAVGINSWVNGENFRSQTTDSGVTEILESIGNNVLISQPAPSVTYITLLSVADTPNNRVLKFQYNTTGSNHKIVCLYTGTNLEYDVLYSSQVIGGFNFSKDLPFHSARVIGGLLYWTQNIVDPNKININKALKANNPSLDLGTIIPYNLPMVYPTQTLIKRPPYYGLEATKEVDGTTTNNYTNDSPFQFAYFYEYCDGEYSKLSAYSPLVPYGPTIPAVDNFILVALPFAEPIDDDVQRIHLCVRFGNTGKTSEFKVFDKAIYLDLLAILSHNAGTAQLSYNFYNNFTPSILDDVQGNTPYDVVPLLSETLEIAKDRTMLGNNLVGYNTPVITSLTGAVVNVGGSGGSYSGVWGYITLNANFTPPGAQNTYNYPFVYVATGAPQNFYYFPAARVNSAWAGGYWTPDLPASVNISDATLTDVSESNFANNLKIFVYPFPTSGATVGTPPWLAGYTATYTFASVPFPVTVVQFSPTTTSNYMKSGSIYNMNIEFFDRFRRKSGVVNVSIKLTIPVRDYTQTSFASAIQWALSNTNALAEIPDWAYYYQIDLTKNLTTRFFLQGQVKAGNYVIRTVDGLGVITYTYSAAYNAETEYATAFDITPLFALGLGYVFTPGDKITVFLSNGTTIPNLPIIGQVGQYVYFQLTNVGAFNFAASYEIYTPYKPVVNEPYYAASPVYPILNPATIARTYSTLTAFLTGDTYAIERTLNSVVFITEAMSPNDRFWQDWETNSGWVNYITNLGQKRLTDGGAFSETYIPDTQVNGLSSFDALNVFQVPQSCGAIEKFILTSKVQDEQGQVMLAICEDETCSIYLGETRVLDNTGATQFIASSTDIIGTINVLKGSYGTINPESVVEFRGDVFWADAKNRKIIQYSNNGLFPISNYKMERFWNQWFIKYNSMTIAEIEALGGRPFLFTAVDNYHLEFLISLPKLSNTPPKGYLPDYPTVIYPFDCLDFQEKTMSYKLGVAGRLPHWQTPYRWSVENFATIQNNLYSFKNGNTYLHNQSQIGYNNFFGTQYKTKIAFVSNIQPNVPKSYDNWGVQSNIKPDWVYIYNNYPYTQSTELYADMIVEREGIWYSTIRRNKLPTGVLNYGLLTGEKIRGVAVYILMEFSVDTIPLELKFVNIGVEASLGHQNQLTK